MGKNKQGFSEILLITAVVVLLGVVGIFVYQNSQLKQEATETQSVVDIDPIETIENTSRPNSVEDDSEISRTYPNHETFPNQDFDFISMNIPSGWQVITKSFGESNSAGFPSHYSPVCETKSCSGIRLVKGNAKLEMVFNFAFDSAGFVCTDNSSYYTNLNDNWARINHPTFSNDSYLYKYSYSRSYGEQQKGFGQGKPSNNEWYYPDLSRESSNIFDFCTWHEPLIKSNNTPQETSGGPSAPAVIATSPRLYKTDNNPIEPSTLKEVDQIISSVEYTK